MNVELQDSWVRMIPKFCGTLPWDPPSYVSKTRHDQGSSKLLAMPKPLSVHRRTEIGSYKAVIGNVLSGGGAHCGVLRVASHAGTQGQLLRAEINTLNKNTNVHKSSE